MKANSESTKKPKRAKKKAKPTTQTQALAVRPKPLLVKCNPSSNFKILNIDDSLTIKEWSNNLSNLTKMRDTVQFWIGDLINFGCDKYGREAVNEVLEKQNIQYKRETKNDFSWVARKIEPSLRKDSLSYSHHKEVASIKTKEEIQYWLDRADEEKLSVRDLRKQIADERKTSIYNPTNLLTGIVTAEEREEKTEEFKKFILRYSENLMKMIKETERFNDYDSDFDIDINEMEKWDLVEKIRKLADKLNSLLSV